MFNRNSVQDVREQFVELYQNKDFVIDKSGVKTLEIINANFFADEQYIFGLPDENYIKREIKWYTSESLNVNTIPGGPPKIWCNVADSNGNINSNYGWCIYSAHNYRQMNHVYNELKNNPNSRRAIMIYNRPSMWEDYNKNGMSDFMCFSGNTIVKSPEGDLPISKLVEIINTNGKYPVFSVNFDTEEREIAWAIRGKKIGRKKLIRVHLNNGEFIDCTADHRFYVRKRLGLPGTSNYTTSYNNEVEAQNLQPGDSMITAMIYKNGKHLAYKKPLRGAFSYNTRKIIHRDYYEWMTNSKLMENEIIHHIDENPYNNSFCNLQKMDDLEHRKHHMLKDNPIYKIQDRTSQLAKMVITNKRLAKNRDLIWYENKCNKTLDEAIEKIQNVYNINRSFREVSRYCKKNNCQWALTLIDRASKLMNISKSNIIEQNCKVSKIEILDTEDDVYDIEVEKNHNFFVGNHGVLVHNCTNAVQYLIRDSRLHAIVQMRSNDVVYGYRNDYAWQQSVLETLAMMLFCEPGVIHWNAGSLHLYERDFFRVEAWINFNDPCMTKKEFNSRMEKLN